MLEQDASKEPAKHVQTQPKPIEPIRTDKAKVIPSSYSSDEERDKANGDKPKWTDKAVVFFTLCLVAVAIWQGIIFRKQWQEMHSGGVDTHALADAAKAQAEAAKAQAEEAKTQVDKMAAALKRRMHSSLKPLLKQLRLIAWLHKRRDLQIMPNSLSTRLWTRSARGWELLATGWKIL
jgi:hypothetical protein